MGVLNAQTGQNQQSEPPIPPDSKGFALINEADQGALAEIGAGLPGRQADIQLEYAVERLPAALIARIHSDVATGTGAQQRAG